MNNEFMNFAIDMTFTDAYRTTVPGESSVWKGIPIKFRKHPCVKSILATGKYRIKYRGPRYDSGRQTTLKKDARAFSIYYK